MPAWFMPYADDVKKMDEQTFKQKMFGAEGVTEQKFDEAKGTAERVGVSTTPITSLEQAIEFFKIDTEEWFIEKWVCNAWDVTMKVDEAPVKRTNYQVKVWLVRKINPIKEIQYEALKARLSPPVVIPQSDDYQMWVVLGCIHRPFHDKTVWSKLMTFLSDYKKQITGIILNGDYLDLKTLSGYEQGEVPIEGLTLRSEYEDGYTGILEIQQAAGREYSRWQKHFLYGNHEHRYFKMMKKPDFYKLGLASPAEALKLDEHGYHVQQNYPDGYVQIGESCKVFHGLYFSENAAAAHLKKEPDFTGVHNHTHRTGFASNGKHQVYDLGWLGDADSLGFKYASRFMKALWRQGFGIIYVDRNNRPIVRPIEIHDKSFFFEGKMY